MDVDPYRGVLLPEIVRQLGVWHKVEPEELHVCVRFSRELPVSMAAKLLGSSTQAQWPCRQIQPPLDCCTQHPGTQVVSPGGGGSYWPACHIHPLSLSARCFGA